MSAVVECCEACGEPDGAGGYLRCENCADVNYAAIAVGLGCDYCNGWVAAPPAAPVCSGCGYDYSALVASGEYYFGEVK